MLRLREVSRETTLPFSMFGASRLDVGLRNTIACTSSRPRRAADGSFGMVADSSGNKGQFEDFQGLATGRYPLSEVAQALVWTRAPGLDSCSWIRCVRLPAAPAFILVEI